MNVTICDKCPVGGKHYNERYEQIIREDIKYIEWLVKGCNKLANEYPEHVLMLKNYLNNIDMSGPLEHNKMQNKFLDDLYARSVAYQIIDQTLDYDFSNVEIIDWASEVACDIWMKVRYFNENKEHSEIRQCFIELKPYIGNDYMRVVQQLERQRYIHGQNYAWTGIYQQVLLVKPEGLKINDDLEFELNLLNNGVLLIKEQYLQFSSWMDHKSIQIGELK